MQKPGDPASMPVPTPRYEVVEIVIDYDEHPDRYYLDNGERWTRLPNGGVLVEREVKE